MTVSPMRATTIVQIPPERYAGRLDAARRLASAQGLAAMLVGVGPDLRYLTGYVAMPLERLTMLVVPAAGATAVTVVVPRLEVEPARRAPGTDAAGIRIETWEE